MKKLPALPPALVWSTARPSIRMKVAPFFQYTPTSGGGKFGSMVIGATAATIGAGGGAGLIITLITASETFAALRAFRAFHTGIERGGFRTCCTDAANLGDNNIVREAQLNHADDVLVGEPFARLLTYSGRYPQGAGNSNEIYATSTWETSES